MQRDNSLPAVWSTNNWQRAACFAHCTSLPQITDSVQHAVHGVPHYLLPVHVARLTFQMTFGIHICIWRCLWCFVRYILGASQVHSMSWPQCNECSLPERQPRSAPLSKFQYYSPDPSQDRPSRQAHTLSSPAPNSRPPPPPSTLHSMASVQRKRAPSTITTQRAHFS